MPLTPKEYAANPSLARIAVSNARRTGTLIALPCQECGAKRVHAHHEDYSKPLEVIWLCPTHHSMRHDEIGWRKTDGRTHCAFLIPQFSVSLRTRLKIRAADLGVSVRKLCIASLQSMVDSPIMPISEPPPEIEFLFWNKVAGGVPRGVVDHHNDLIVEAYRLGEIAGRLQKTSEPQERTT
jgi:hypothetical protein